MECRLPSWNRLASDGRRRTHRIFARHLPRLAPCPLALPTLQRNWLTAQRWHIYLSCLLHPLACQQRHYLPAPALCCKKHDDITRPYCRSNSRTLPATSPSRTQCERISPKNKSLMLTLKAHCSNWFLRATRQSDTRLPRSVSSLHLQSSH